MFIHEFYKKYCLLSVDEIQKLAIKHAEIATLLSLGAGNKAGVGGLWLVS